MEGGMEGRRRERKRREEVWIVKKPLAQSMLSEVGQANTHVIEGTNK